MILGLQTHGEICTRGLTLLITHKKKLKKKGKGKGKSLKCVGPFGLSAKH